MLPTQIQPNEGGSVCYEHNLALSSLTLNVCILELLLTLCKLISYVKTNNFICNYETLYAIHSIQMTMHLLKTQSKLFLI
jgi:hypothetical protein